MGLALSMSIIDFMHPPSGRSLREATFKVFETGPLHDFLEKKSVSEPRWEG
jgi:hypothetical protein